jgi:putative zinc finger protein
MSKREIYDSPSWRCPDEMRLAAYAEGGLKPADRTRLEQHLAACDYCLGQVSALARLQDAKLPEADADLLHRARGIVRLKPGSQWLQAWRWAAACAATACLAIVVTLWVRAPQSADRDTVRTGYVQPAALELLIPREGVALTRPAIEFRWTAVNRALFYEVRVLTADGDRVWQTRADGPEARPPGDVVFRAGQTYFVSVSAWLPEGKTVKSSIVGFRVTDQ